MMPPHTGMLTDDHREWISQECAEWLRAVRPTEPVDRTAAEAAIRRVYETAGLQPPRVVWADSPYGCVLAGATLQVATCGNQLDELLGGQLQDQLLRQLAQQLWHQLEGRLGDQFWEQFREHWGQFGKQLGDHIEDQLWDQLRDLERWLGDQGGDRVLDAAHSLVSASFDITLDASHAGFALALFIAGLPADPRLDALVDANRRLFWWIPLRDVALVSERPTALHFDDQGRLHNADGPAITYRDGWEVWAWHDVRVEPWVITDPTVEAIAAEPNVEVRRAAIEVLGWDAYVRQSGLALVGEADDPGNPGQRLALYDMPEQVYGAPVRVLLCANGTVGRDGTRRRYGLTVPATITDPVEAAGWTYGLTRDQYAQLRRRT